MNFDRLRFVAERAELGEQREAVLAVTIPEKPGSFRKFISVLGNRNITEFNYRYADAERAHIFVGVTVHNRNEAGAWSRCSSATSCRARPHRRRDGQVARALHGGRARAAGRERGGVPLRLPRAPGALMNFLSNLRSDWNISLFHYRNHGSTSAACWSACRSAGDKAAFDDFLQRLATNTSPRRTTRLPPVPRQLNPRQLRRPALPRPR